MASWERSSLHTTMAGHTSNDRDPSKHLVILKSIRTKGLNKLEVVFNGVPLILSDPVKTGASSRLWTLDCEVRMFPSFGDSLLVKCSKQRRFSKLFRANAQSESVDLPHNVIAEEFEKQGHSISFSVGKWTLTLEVAEGRFDAAVATEIERLVPLLNFQDGVPSGNSFLESTRPFQDILKNISDADVGLQTLENACGVLENDDPLAKALIAALSMPYKSLEIEANFKQDLQGLAEAMLTTCKCLTDVESYSNISAPEELTKLLRDAALFLKVHQMKRQSGQSIGEQFQSRLTEYVAEFNRQNKDIEAATASNPSPLPAAATSFEKHSSVDVVESTQNEGITTGTARNPPPLPDASTSLVMHSSVDVAESTDPSPDHDGDISRHLVIKKSVIIHFTDATELAELEVLFNGESIKAKRRTAKRMVDTTHEWILECDIPIIPAPKSDDTIAIRAYSKNSLFPKLAGEQHEENTITWRVIVDAFQAQRRKLRAQREKSDAREQLILFHGQKFNVTLNVATCSFADFITFEQRSPKYWDSLIPKPATDAISWVNANLKDAKKLESVLESIPIAENALQVVESAFDTLANAHPLAKAILTALSIPYKLMKNEQEFKKNVKDLTDAMLTTCECLMDIQYHVKIASANDKFLSIMKTLRDAALFVGIYLGKGRFGQFVGAQFPRKLEGFAEDLVRLKNDFQTTIIIQIARDVDRMASMTSDDYFRKRLESIEGPPLGEGCLEGTRAKILEQARGWIEDYGSKENILWIVGAPGAGKSTIATTLAGEFADKAPFCATFFIKRDVPALRNVRHIWQTLAYGLAKQHTGVKAALMRTLNQKKGEPRNDSILKQFQQLIKGPLESDMKETSFRSSKIPYPLIIIDALDECFSTDDVGWEKLLDSLGCWAQLSGMFKLIVTSRDVVDIRQTLGKVSYRIDLTTGDDASDDSIRDVEIFFKDRFASIKKKQPSLSVLSAWPEEALLRELTAYAAGLFVWADMVVKYVGLRTVGSNPDQRLKTVLSDIRTRRGRRKGASMTTGEVDRLYARIILEAFLRSEPDEREKAKRCLAAILLAKEPLQKSSLVELLSTDVLDETSLESTLYALSPLIPVSNTTGEVRVCHKTVSDFLLSHERSARAMKYVAQHLDRPSQAPGDRVIGSFILNSEVENGFLSLACLRLASRSFSMDIDSVSAILKQSSGSFYYARRHWLEHLESAGMIWKPKSLLPNFRGLADEMEVAYKCLGRYSTLQTSLKQETLALKKSLDDATTFANQCIVHKQCSVKNRNTSRANVRIKTVANPALDIEKHVLNISTASNAFLRKWLQPFDQAQLDSKCMEGTRVRVLKLAKKWLVDPKQRNILWIVGAPGAGKSAIATTLVSEFTKSRLCAKAFAKRDYADRRDPSRIWRTLAYELGSLHVALKSSIIDALCKESHRPKNVVEEQLRFRDMVKDAINEQRGLSVVFVVDALDECFTEDDEAWRALLETLAGWADLPSSFKLVVTSRDIHDIRNALEKVSHPIHLSTGIEVSDEARRDIKTFLRMKLSGTRSGQFSEEDIEELTGYAAGSFIWARMVAELVGKIGAVGPVKDILSGVQDAGNIDILYGKSLLDTLGPLDKRRRSAVRSFLATLVLAKDPMRRTDLVEFIAPEMSSLDERQQLVDSMVEDLNSIISVGDNQVLRIPHKSFSDFLLDYGRSLAAMKRLLTADEDPRTYLVSREDDSARMSISCLRLMECSLKFNACGIESSHKLNDDIPELATRISENTSSALVYACRFWAEHLKDCDHEDQHFRVQAEPLLKTLLDKNLLYWLETLSLLQAVLSAKTSLQITADVLEGYGSDLAEVARDACLFVEMFEEPITASASHIYHSALSFCPSNSRISRIYAPQYPSLLSVVMGRRIEWDVAPTTNDAHEGEVGAVAFSPDGRKLVSASLDTTVRVWDPKTGQPLSAPFTGHSDGVRCIAVSPDGRLIASGDWEGTLRIWDSDTGACPLGSIKAHNGIVYSAAFSPDGSRIATGSKDNTVKVWNVATGDLCLGPLTGHTKYVNSVAFSPDGTVIASGSDDETIRIWDARTGECRKGPLTGHTGIVYCVAFSADGCYLASGSNDETIRLWDVAQGFSQASVTPVKEGALSLSFSPDSNYLVSDFDDDRALCFWSVSSGNLEQIGLPIYGHTDVVRSVAFAPDGLSVASGGLDNSVRIWKVPPQLSGPIDAAGLESLDAHGDIVLSDESFIDKDGWMRTSRRDGASVLFWVPKENRVGVWWPRNTAVIDKQVTKFDFRRFVHGENWTECRRALDSEVV